MEMMLADLATPYVVPAAVEAQCVPCESHPLLTMFPRATQLELPHT